ncbi:MAG: N-acetyltransferase [Kiritimatiellae bacterium]|nr:N-acetyltransferase [Kiritimatiellia bacterium]
MVQQRRLFNKNKNPFFKHSSAQFFIAIKQGDVVGRIAAIKFIRHLEIYQDDTGFFGFFECIDHRQVAQSLFEAAAEWLKSQGLTRMRGPINFTMNHQCGLLVQGFHLMPGLMMPYNPPYYENLITSFGFEKAQDLFAYTIDKYTVHLTLLAKISRATRKKLPITLRQFDLNNSKEEVHIFHHIYKDAWSGNWGMVPKSKEEFQRDLIELKLFLRPQLIYIPEIQGKPVGLACVVPDFNKAIQFMDGKLFPFGILNALREAKQTKKVRFILLGVLKPYRKRGIETILMYQTIRSIIELGYISAELSWILESNDDTNRLIQHVGGRRNKTYRIYEKTLGR